MNDENCLISKLFFQVFHRVMEAVDFKRPARLIQGGNTITFIDSSFQIDTASRHECSNTHFPVLNKLRGDDNAAVNAKTLFKGKQSNK